MLAERYLLEEEIDRGGMTSLWRARDEVLARHVAVKVLNPELAQDQGLRERFLKEALGAARLSHPNIAQIYDTGSESLGAEAEQHFIVLEYCGGGSLEDLRATGTALEASRVTGMAGLVCNALQYAHASGVVHGDLRPANILLTTDGGIKVSDFGIARAAFATRDLDTTGTILGSVQYMPPEQLEGREPDARSDLYSLGVVIYELLVGRPPFNEADLATLLQRSRNPAPPLRSIKGGIPRALDAAVSKALAPRPEDRFQSAEEMREALERAVAPSGATAVFRAPPPPAAPLERQDTPQVGRAARNELRRVLPILLLIGAAIAAAFLVPHFISSNKHPRGGGTTQTTVAQPAGGAKLQTTATDFDPYGGDGEHPELVPNLTDGDPSTAWTTSHYSAPLQAQKPGVGVLFDLGSSQEVGRVEIDFGSPGAKVELRAGDTASPNEQGFSMVKAIDSVSASENIDTSGTKARYWLVWITELPGGVGGNASIDEVRFFGP
jgi:hypothetical protein